MADGTTGHHKGAAAGQRAGEEHPPLNLFALLSPGSTGDWMAIHRYHARDTWQRARGPVQKARLLGRCLLWPLRAATLALGNTLHAGGFLKSRTAKGRVRQFAEQWKLAVVGCISPRAYVDFALYDEANAAAAQRYFHRYETQAPATLYRAISSDGAATAARLDDRAAFHDGCLEAGLPTPEIHLLLEGDRVAGTPEVPARDLFVKARFAESGRAGEAWFCDARGDYRNTNGDRLDRANLVARLRRESRARDLVVQERLRNSAALDEICFGSELATARIVTVINEAGRPEAVAAVFCTGSHRSGAGDPAPGGLIASIDLKTGELGPAIGAASRSPWCRAHAPTRRAFCGQSLPDWEGAIGLVSRAHRVFAGCAAIAWNVAFADEGPTLVAGDPAPCVHLLQRAYRAPLGGTRFGQLLGFHLRGLASESST